MPHNPNTSVVILAAGFSSRMKQEKFSLMYNEQITFLEKIVLEYITFGCEEIIVVMNEKGIALKEEIKLNFPKNVSIVLNKYPERERFYSLQIGLRALKDQTFTFIQNIDNPFVDQEVLSLLFEQKDKADYIAPIYKGRGGHPILISNKIVKALSEEKDYDINLKIYLKEFDKLTPVSLNKKLLFNINDLSDYESFKNLNNKQ